MSIEQIDTVDLIALDEAGIEVELTISDHLDWADEDVHLRLLQTKVYRYLDFVYSGEMDEKYPKAHGRKVIIRVRALHPPSPDAEVLIQKLAGVAAEEGVGLEALVEDRPRTAR